MSAQTYNMTPSPASLIESLRAIGYSMKTAVADLIDNSITAEATQININFSWYKDQPWLAISDNGKGMSSESLIKAMRLGSKNPLETRSEDDLGRFGLGMKTASFSQCRILTVVSKNQGSLAGMEWNLDSFKDNPNVGWELPLMKEADLKKDSLLEEIIKNLLPKSHGTVVLWRKLDHIDPSRKRSLLEKKLNSLIAEVRAHIEITFHRYLESKKKNEKIAVFVNGDRLKPHNPFNPNAQATQELPEEKIPLNKEHIIIKPYILPHSSKVSRDDYDKYRGEGSYFQNQGFYIYRNKRLIIKGTWFRLIPKSELTKLIRVRVDIPNSLDHMWKIDVKKSVAAPPVEVRERLKDFIGKIEFRGKTVFRRRGSILISKVKTPAWKRSVINGKIRYIINKEHPVLKNLKSSLSEEKAKIFENYIETVECSFPADTYFDDFATKPEKIDHPKLSVASLGRMLDIFFETCHEENMSNKEIISKITSMDPFFSHQEETLNLLKKRRMINDE